MTRSSAMAARLREVFLDGQWIANTNYKQQIERTGWQEAIAKVGDHNSIAALVYHINYYLEGLLPVFDGGKLEISDKFSFGLSPISSAEDWQQLAERLLANAAAFAEKVERMPDEQLDAAFVNEKYGTWLRNIEGMIEHSYYHLGQLSLIHKLLQTKKQ